MKEASVGTAYDNVRRLESEFPHMARTHVRHAAMSVDVDLERIARGYADGSFGKPFPAGPQS